MPKRRNHRPNRLISTEYKLRVGGADVRFESNLSAGFMPGNKYGRIILIDVRFAVNTRNIKGLSEPRYTVSDCFCIVRSANVVVYELGMLSGQYKLHRCRIRRWSPAYAVTRPSHRSRCIHTPRWYHRYRFEPLCVSVLRAYSPSLLPFLFMPVSPAGPPRRAKQLARRRAPWIYVPHRKKS